MAGQYAILNLETKELPEGPVQVFTLASSPTKRIDPNQVQE